MRNTFEVPELYRIQIPWYRRPPIEIWRQLRQVVYCRDHGLCMYCSTAVALHECHIHHVQPLSQGGTNHPSNLKTVCVRCHKERHPHMKTKAEALRIDYLTSSSNL